jgi:MerR family transcriptional regulator/heat shock protein HspR
MVERNRKQPLYMISVVAEMFGVHPQTLRLYEKEGLISPKRIKKQRLYSDEDIDRLHLILELTRDLGVNKAGVDIILRMRKKLLDLQREMEAMMKCLEEETRRDFESRLRRIFNE